ncbi:LysM domain-containing protein, partial [Penicillium rolfsii]
INLIEAEYGITFEELIVLNTYVNSTCGNIWPVYAYCVSDNATANSSTSMQQFPPISVTTSDTLITATNSETIMTPTPSQTALVSGCTTFYEAISGDSCNAIATSYGIPLDEFYEWNAAVGNDCSGTWLDYYYCVWL